MTDDLEPRLREALSTRAAEPIGGTGGLLDGVYRRHRVHRRYGLAATAAIAVAVTTGGTATYLSTGSPVTKPAMRPASGGGQHDAICGPMRTMVAHQQYHGSAMSGGATKEVPYPMPGVRIGYIPSSAGDRWGPDSGGSVTITKVRHRLTSFDWAYGWSWSAKRNSYHGHSVHVQVHCGATAGAAKTSYTDPITGKLPLVGTDTVRGHQVRYFAKGHWRCAVIRVDGGSAVQVTTHRLAIRPIVAGIRLTG